MKFKNIEIERCVAILNDPTSFRMDNKVKQPPKIRFAIRSNLDKLVSAYKTYDTTRRETISGYIADNIIEMTDDGNYIINDGYVEKVNQELSDLNNIEVDIDLMLIDKSDLDDFLKTVSISTPEEDVLLLFTRRDEDA